jgi:3-oxoacyl-[acyl-carrier-protein] synthase I
LRPLVITHFATANPLGLGRAATLEALRERRAGLRPMDLGDVSLDTWIGRIGGLEDEPVVSRLSQFDCRNNRLAQLGLQQDAFEAAVARARARYGHRRIAVLMGTSTSGMEHCERAYRERDRQTDSLPAWFQERYTLNLFSIADFVQRYLDLGGPAAAISTACSSSAKVFASAHRMIEAGYADAAIVGGVDSLCLTTLYGFASLDLLSHEPCRPCDRARDGISIGEAAGFALLERPEHADGDVALVGYGESSDAFHMSSPDPAGDGAYLSMQLALQRAGIEPSEVDYINMHGTGTPANDRIEDRAIFRLFGNAVPCSSTKGWTGHTLGAAGIIEAIICALCMEARLIPGTLNLNRIDPAFASCVAAAPETRDLRYVMSNSFGFGGSNCSLVFGRRA